MELDRFLRELLRRWWVVSLFVMAGIAGTVLYFFFFGTATAAASVAVLEPAVTKGLTGQQAQLGFASVAESYTVADRVIQRLGLDIPTESLKNRVSVKLSRSLITNVASPLYIVQVADPDPKQAIVLAAAVVQEARVVFAELNTLDPTQVDLAFRGEEQRLRGELEQARAALKAFEDREGARSLRAQIDSQRNLVTTLRQSARLSGADLIASTAARAEIEKSLTTAQSELDRLSALQPQYDRLAFEVAVASSIYAQLAGRGSEVPVAQNDQRVLQGRVGNARTQLEQRRGALTAFQRANNIGDLGLEIVTQTGVVNELRRTTANGDTTRQAALNNEQARLDRLRRLQPEFDRLTFDVNVAASVYAQTVAQANEPPIPSNNAAIQEQSSLARSRLEAARAALESFQQEHGVSDFTQLLTTQTTLVNDLKRQLIVARTPTNGFESAVAAETAELQRQLALQPTYDELTSRVDQVSAGLNQLQLRKLDALLNGAFAPTAQVKLLDAPRIQPNILWTLVIFALGILLGAFAGIIVIYLWAYYVRSPQTETEAGEIVDLPVLVRVPRRRA